MDALVEVWAEAGGEPEALAAVELTGPAQVLPSIFAVTTAATAAVAATTLAAARLWLERGGPDARVRVDGREATIAFRSERYLQAPAAHLGLGDPLTGDYRTADGWIRLHGNYPQHRNAALAALGLGGPTGKPVPEHVTEHASEPVTEAVTEAVTETVARWRAEDLEEAVVAAGGAAAALRSAAQWVTHPQGAAVARLPLVGRAWGSPPVAPLAPVPAGRPLEGVRVLDLTRVIAGPVAGRALAAHGAEVLRVGADHLPLVPTLVVDTGFGKRFTHIDLRTTVGRDALRELIRGADVVLQGYRPGALHRYGFGAEACAELRPGLVYVEINAWGQVGPWRARRGFDSLVQMACGIADEGRIAVGDPHGPPRPLPAQVLDHATGFLAALGAVQALRHRQAGGGGSHVEVSLAGTARWLDSLGRVPNGLLIPDPTARDVADLLVADETPFGPVRHVRAPGMIDGAPPRWDGPPRRPGADPPRWQA